MAPGADPPPAAPKLDCTILERRRSVSRARGLEARARRASVTDYVAARARKRQHCARDTSLSRIDRIGPPDGLRAGLPVRPGCAAGRAVRMGGRALLREGHFGGGGHGKVGRRDRLARGGNLQRPRGRICRHVARAEPHVVVVPPRTPRRRRARPGRAESEQRYAARAARARLQRAAASPQWLPADAAKGAAAAATGTLAGGRTAFELLVLPNHD